MTQLSLFGCQPVHVGCRGFCVMCHVSLAFDASLNDCGACPGWVEPAPPWAVLGVVEEPATLERAA